MALLHKDKINCERLNTERKLNSLPIKSIRKIKPGKQKRIKEAKHKTHIGQIHSQINIPLFMSSMEFLTGSATNDVYTFLIGHM